MALAILSWLLLMHVLGDAVANGAVRSIKIGLHSTQATQATLARVLAAYLDTILPAVLLGSRIAAVNRRRRILLTVAIAFAIGSLASAANLDSSQHVPGKGVLAMCIAASVLAGLLGLILIGAGSTRLAAATSSARALNTRALRPGFDYSPEHERALMAWSPASGAMTLASRAR
jgi:MFS family permease